MDINMVIGLLLYVRDMFWSHNFIKDYLKKVLMLTFQIFAF